MKLFKLALLCSSMLLSSFANNSNNNEFNVSNIIYRENVATIPLENSLSTLIVTGKNGENVDGKYTVESTEESIIVTTIIEDGDYKIEGTSDVEVKEEIVVKPNFTGSIILKNLNLSYDTYNSAKAPIHIDASSNIELILDGKNTLRAPSKYPAIAFYGKDTSGTLTFSAINSGELVAIGGSSNAAVIGGGDYLLKKFDETNQEYSNSGNIVINGGRFDLETGSVNSTAIGAGAGEFGENSFINKIQINSGYIYAKARSKNAFGSAIGSGFRGDINEIEINGGTIYAYTDAKNTTNVNDLTTNTAIGCGYQGKINKITINGGDITTTTQLGAGIGNSDSSQTNHGTIEINGGFIETRQHTSAFTSIGATDGSINVSYDIKINGATIKTKNFSSQPTNNNNNNLTLLKITEVPSFNNVKVDNIDFNVPFVKSNDRTLYLYVEKNDHVVTLFDGTEEIKYIAKYIKDYDYFNVTKDSGPSIPSETINAIPELTVNDIELELNDNFSQEIAKTLASAYDQEEGNLDDKIEITSYNVNTSVAGTYYITFKVSDSKNATATKTIKVIVKEKINIPPTITATDKEIIQFSNLTDAVILSWATAYDNEDNDLTNEIKIVSHNIDTSRVGVYQVTYKVTDKGGLTVTKTINVTVKEKASSTNTAPQIIVENKEISQNLELTEEMILDWALAYDNEEGDITERLEIVSNNVDTSKPGTYEVTYKVVDKEGLSTTKTITVTVLEKITPPIPPNNSNNTKIILLSTLIPLGTIILIVIAVFTYLYLRKKAQKNNK